MSETYVGAGALRDAAELEPVDDAAELEELDEAAEALEKQAAEAAMLAGKRPSEQARAARKARRG